MKRTLLFENTHYKNADFSFFNGEPSSFTADSALFSPNEEGYFDKSPVSAPAEESMAQYESIAQYESMAQHEANEFQLGALPRLRLCRLLSKPVYAGGGALLPLKGVTFSLSSRKIRHLIVRFGEKDGDASEIYLPFDSARLSAWRITPDSLRPRSPKNTQRLLLNKPVYSTGGTYLGKLTDALIKDGVLRLLYADGKPYCADNLYAANDALLLRPAEPFPLGQALPQNLRNEKSGGVPVRFSEQINRSALQFFLREGKLIFLTTSLPLFKTSDTSASSAASASASYANAQEKHENKAR